MIEAVKTNKFSIKARWGHIYPWLVWSFAIAFIFFKYILEVSPGVMSSDWMREFNVTGAELGNIGACYFYAYLAMQLPNAVLIEAFGCRRIVSMAILITGFGCYLLAHAHSYGAAAFARFLTGFGASASAIACLKLTSIWFPAKRFAMLAGLMMTAGMLGAVCGAAPLSVLVDVVGGRHALLVFAQIGTLLALLFWLFVREQPAADILPACYARPKLFEGLHAILSNKQSWVLSIYACFALAPLAAFGEQWGVSYLQYVDHFKRTNAAEAISMVFVGFAVGCPLLGWWSDNLGKRLPIIKSSMRLAFVFLAAAFYLPHLPIALACVLLFCFGFCLSSFIICFAMIREVNPPAMAAISIGVMNTVCSLSAFADPIVGKMLDLGWDGTMQNHLRIFSISDYRIAMAPLLLYMLAALFLLRYIKETYCEQQAVPPVRISDLVENKVSLDAIS